MVLRHKWKEATSTHVVTGITCLNLDIFQALANLNIFAILGFVFQIAFLTVFLKNNLMNEYIIQLVCINIPNQLLQNASELLCSAHSLHRRSCTLSSQSESVYSQIGSDLRDYAVAGKP